MTAKYLNNYMKMDTKSKVGKRTLLIVSVIGIAVGLAIMITSINQYIYISSNGGYYGVKISGSVASHLETSDLYIISTAAVLTASAAFLLVRVTAKKRRK